MVKRRHCAASEERPNRTETKGYPMTTNDPQVQPVQSKEEQAEKLRRVLSVKDPSQDKPVVLPPKPALR